jgi:glycosyltransferase involved in cell wall biosynthesis
MYNWVDTDFFRPGTLAKLGTYIFSCGRENRDYETLMRAASLTSCRFKLQATGFFEVPGLITRTNPSNVEVSTEKVPFDRLRDLYDQAKFVVVPLHSVPYAAGVTGLLEAMAMAKPVIVTQSPGLQGYEISESSGFLVPPGNAAALASAIRELDNRTPERLAEMGEHNRRWVVQNAGLDEYVDKVATRMIQSPQ